MTWRVGVLFSQTGVTAAIERSQLNGTLLAVDEINKSGGVLGGRPIAIAYEDSAGNKDQAMNAARKLIGRDIHYLEMYNASEGFFAAQEIPGDDGMLLFTDHGIFMEFMPVSEYGKKDPKTIGLEDVEKGRNYALVISTNGGLWRYLLGDTIQFTSLRPFRIRVSGRLKHFINAFGEELIIDNTDKAIAMASEKTGAIVNDYTAAPVYFSDQANGAHEWLIEFEKEPDSMDHFIKELDSSLKNLNSDYEAKRHKNIALGMPVLHLIKKGVFSEWLRSKGKLGGQHKVPRLSNERILLEEILKLNNGAAGKLAI